MSLTRRGWIVVGLIAASILSSALFGARGLNAIAAPGVVALVAAAVQIRRTPRPTIERELPARGHRGEAATVRLHVEVDRPFSARITDQIDPGLDAVGNERDATLSTGTLRYDLRLASRGERTVGPVRVVARDVLGLVSRAFVYRTRHTVLVRPRVHLLAGARREDLVLLYGGAGDDRQQFDQLRIYQRGDPVRDIHWKSSAKQPDDDLVVKQFTADEGTRTVEVATTAAPGCADPMADATASIATHLIDAGVRVGLRTPTGRIEPDDGIDHRNRILDHLARTAQGPLRTRDRARADVIVESTSDGTRVDIDGRACAFSELAGTSVDDERYVAPGVVAG